MSICERAVMRLINREDAGALGNARLHVYILRVPSCPGAFAVKAILCMKMKHLQVWQPPILVRSFIYTVTFTKWIQGNYNTNPYQVYNGQ